MQGIIGLIFTAAGAGGAWWAFSQAAWGSDSYNLVGVVAVIIGLLGILLIFMQIKKWWMSE